MRVLWGAVIGPGWPASLQIDHRPAVLESRPGSRPGDRRRVPDWPMPANRSSRSAWEADRLIALGAALLFVLCLAWRLA